MNNPGSMGSVAEPVLEPVTKLPRQSCGLQSALHEATEQLAGAGVSTPRRDAELLAAHLLRLSLGELRVAAIQGVGVPPGFHELVAERARRVPLQHLTGVAGFRRLELAVGPGVFVPRPETEVVAQAAIDELTDRRVRAGCIAENSRMFNPLVIDLGTGSGALALALADEVPGARVYAVELSELACAWMQQNIERTGLSVTLRQGDLRTAFPDLEGQANVVVSNPPYIPEQAVPVDPEVAKHDPQLALYGGSADGMELPAAAARRAAALLRPGGYFIMEHAECQATAARRVLCRLGFAEVSSHQDLSGRDRASSGRLPAQPPDDERMSV